ncbi:MULTISPECIES: peroxiredoxin [unclassified Herbaspirillum]|uniref:peroxiredoxin n=1 Tax=unclassified Herbaspirillum TaxID=2624150 RepID=UPI001150452C|nr:MULTISPECIES: peroxiredoxin [unclassified Herbaspirillum]MBB5392636.1 peroxiredoxin [Herbaspirillum sp. SJZ102]TQK06273.1 peroxiredoxin [Herbaspirillum sp. SJZ130]TQK12249.1 peroxiredoxin [Herbaspirillum sp. SJZ106]TWC68476.1 peroxiredoxin [Herbaspirillum sp. SJZ099]
MLKTSSEHPALRRLRRAATPLLLATTLLAQPALAVLKPGEKAPDFSAPSSLGGQVSTFSLNAALKKGPVVLYFYPAAFTTGCTIEAHLFAEATERYKALGATVIGVSADNIDTLNKFSVSECRSKFAVAADVDRKIMKSYDAVLSKDAERASRTSYVITPDHTILYEYSSMDPDKHVENTLHALQQWVNSRKGP